MFGVAVPRILSNRLEYTCHIKDLPLAAPLGVNGAAVASLDDIAVGPAFVASPVGVKEGESTFSVFF
jgi:hypothetical protein